MGGGAKEEQQRLNLSGTLCRPSIRPITINCKLKKTIKAVLERQFEFVKQ